MSKPSDSLGNKPPLQGRVVFNKEKASPWKKLGDWVQDHQESIALGLGLVAKGLSAINTQDFSPPAYTSKPMTIRHSGPLIQADAPTSRPIQTSPSLNNFNRPTPTLQSGVADSRFGSQLPSQFQGAVSPKPSAPPHVPATRVSQQIARRSGQLASIINRDYQQQSDWLNQQFQTANNVDRAAQIRQEQHKLMKTHGRELEKIARAHNMAQGIIHYEARQNQPTSPPGTVDRQLARRLSDFSKPKPTQTSAEQVSSLNTENLHPVFSTQKIQATFQQWNNRIKNASTQSEKQHLIHQKNAEKIKLAKIMSSPSTALLSVNDNYIIIGEQAYGQKEAYQVDLIDIEHIIHTGKHLPSLGYPTRPDLPKQYYPDVTVAYNKLLNNIVTEVKHELKHKGKLLGVYPLFLINFPNNGDWDTQVNHGLPGQKILRDPSTGTPILKDSKVKTTDQYAIYKNQVVRAGFLSNYAYGYATAAAKLQIDEARSAVFVANVRAGIWQDNPADTQAINTGYYDYWKLHPHEKKPRNIFSKF